MVGSRTNVPTINAALAVLSVHKQRKACLHSHSGMRDLQTDTVTHLVDTPSMCAFLKNTYTPYRLTVLIHMYCMY